MTNNRKKIQINGRYLSQIESSESMDYNSDPQSNIYFLMRISAGLKGNLDQDQKDQLLQQIDKLISEHKESVKREEGEKQYPGLMIKK
jgi:hypothetical protein